MACAPFARRGHVALDPARAQPGSEARGSSRCPGHAGRAGGFGRGAGDRHGRCDGYARLDGRAADPDHRFDRRAAATRAAHGGSTRFGQRPATHHDRRGACCLVGRGRARRRRSPLRGLRVGASAGLAASGPRSPQRARGVRPPGQRGGPRSPRGRTTDAGGGELDRAGPDPRRRRDPGLHPARTGRARGRALRGSSGPRRRRAAATRAARSLPDLQVRDDLGSMGAPYARAPFALRRTLQPATGLPCSGCCRSSRSVGSRASRCSRNCS